MFPGFRAGSVPNFVKIFNQTDPNEAGGDLVSNIYVHADNGKETLRRTPSAPPSCNRRDETEEPDTSAPSGNESLVPPTEIFGRVSWNHYRGDVAGYSEGIELVGFNRIGTLYCPRNSRERARAFHSQDTETTRNVDALVDNLSRRYEIGVIKLLIIWLYSFVLEVCI